MKPKPMRRFSHASVSSLGIAVLLYDHEAAGSRYGQGQMVTGRANVTSLSSFSSSGTHNFVDVSQALHPLISHMKASRSGLASNTGSNNNEFGQQATGGIQIGDNSVSNIINIGHNLENEEAYHCSMKTGCSSMVGGVLYVLKTKGLVFQPYTGDKSKLIMPLNQVKLVKPLTYRGHKRIQLWMTEGDSGYQFSRFGNFEGAFRRLLDAKPHPYLSFSCVRTTIDEDYCVQGYFSKVIAGEDLMRQPKAIQIRESYQCIHDSYLGHIKGTLYITSTLLEFCSDNPVSYYNNIMGYTTHQGDYYTLAIPFGKIKACNGHGPPERDDQETQLDSVPSWHYGCWQTPSITIHATPFNLAVSTHPRPDGGCNLCTDPGVYVFKFMAIKGYNKCIAGFGAVFDAIHKKKNGICHG